jgi:hypothetical protein
LHCLRDCPFDNNESGQTFFQLQTADQRLALAFTTGSSSEFLQLNQVDCIVRMDTAAAAPQTMNVELYTSSATECVPGSLLHAQATASATVNDTIFVCKEFVFAQPVLLQANTTYWLVLHGEGTVLFTETRNVVTNGSGYSQNNCAINIQDNPSTVWAIAQGPDISGQFHAQWLTSQAPPPSSSSLSTSAVVAIVASLIVVALLLLWLTSQKNKKILLVNSIVIE